MYETTGRKAEMAVRVLIVDDHPIVRRGLCALIESQPDLEVCGEAEDFADAVSLLEYVRPHIVLIDLALRNSDGMEVLRYINRHWIGVKAIIVSSRNNPSSNAAAALKAGAKGYVTKHEAAEHIIDAIKATCQDKVYLSPAIGYAYQ